METGMGTGATESCIAPTMRPFSYRLSALENGRMVGAMQLSVAPVPIPVSIPGLRPTWLYSSRGPTVESPDSPALPALLESAHALAHREHAVVLRLEPNIADDDP